MANRFEQKKMEVDNTISKADKNFISGIWLDYKN